MGGGSFAVDEGQRQTSTLLLLLNLIRASASFKIQTLLHSDCVARPQVLLLLCLQV